MWSSESMFLSIDLYWKFQESRENFKMDLQNVLMSWLNRWTISIVNIRIQKENRPSLCVCFEKTSNVCTRRFWIFWCLPKKARNQNSSDSKNDSAVGKKNWANARIHMHVPFWENGSNPLQSKLYHVHLKVNTKKNKNFYGIISFSLIFCWTNHKLQYKVKNKKKVKKIQYFFYNSEYTNNKVNKLRSIWVWKTYIGLFFFSSFFFSFVHSKMNMIEWHFISCFQSKK